MSFPEPRVVRALDEDPTLLVSGSGSFSPRTSPNNRSRWSSPTRTWDQKDGNIRKPLTRDIKPAKWLTPDHEEVSSIDRPLDRPGLAGQQRYFHNTSLDVSSIDGPRETSGQGLVTSTSSCSFSSEEWELPKLKTTKTNTPSQPKRLVAKEEKEEEVAVVTPSSSPLRYRRANPQHRRMLAKKLIMSRKKASGKPENESSSEKDSEEKKSSSDRENIFVQSRSVPFPNTMGPKPYTGTGNALMGSWHQPRKENEILTRAPESTDETVSWASTLTTDPSRLVHPYRQPGNENSIPYWKMDALPSHNEDQPSQGPPSKLDRHFQQQKSVTTSQSSQQKSSKKSFHHYDEFQHDEEHTGGNADERGNKNNGSHPYPPRPQLDANARAILSNTDERDDAVPPHRRTNSGSPELSDIYRLSAPDRSFNAMSDPGMSNLALAAKRWAHFSDSRPSPLINYGNTEDVLVTLHPGGETFEHSSHILAYASPVLRRKLQPVLGGWYRLDLMHTSVVEWQLIRPFLEPHSVQQAVVTPSNLSHLLPWFKQLQLDILLAECDQLLVTLEFVQAYSPQSMATASVNDKETRHGPQTKDMVDVLLLTEISSLAHLKKTRDKALDILESYLALHPGLAADSETLPILMRLLQDHPNIRQRLWRRSLVRFLPSDLPVFQEKERNQGESELVIVETMVYNTLFPFLLRNGLQKAAQEDEFHRRSLELEERWKRFRERQQRIQQTSQIWNSTIRDNSILEDPRCFLDENTTTDGSLSFSRSERGPESVNTSKVQLQKFGGASPLAMLSLCEEAWEEDGKVFADWWIKFSDQALLMTLDNPQPTKALQESVAEVRTRAHTEKLLQEISEINSSPRSRTNWLELILQRLNRPPIFKPDPNEDNDFRMESKKDRRKFLC